MRAPVFDERGRRLQTANACPFAVGGKSPKQEKGGAVLSGFKGKKGLQGLGQKGGGGGINILNGGVKKEQYFKMDVRH